MQILLHCEKLTSAKADKPALRLTLTTDGRTVIDEEALLTAPTYEALTRLLEYQLANGWELIEPHEIGALTSSILLSDNAQRDDQGNLTSIDSVYWFPNYQLDNEVQLLYSLGFVEFPLA